jgi:RNA polymerase primary sigma factor
MSADSNWYSAQIKRIPMLTASEEITLGTLVQNWLNDPDPSPSLQRRGKRAQNRMVEANLRLVVTVANKYSRQVPSADFMDLVQAGNLGLVRAVEKYDPTRGYKFSTYAYWWIRQGVSRHVEQFSRSIRLPSSCTQKLYQVATATRRLVQELHRNPSKAELAKALEISTQDLELLITRGQACVSLDAYAKNNDNLSTIGELIADPSGIGIDEQLEQLDEANTTQRLLQRLDELTPRQRMMIEGTIGLGQSVRTITDLAKEIGINTAQASKLLREAKNRLRWLVNTRHAEDHPKSPPLPLPTAFEVTGQLELTEWLPQPIQPTAQPRHRRWRRSTIAVDQASLW